MQLSSFNDRADSKAESDEHSVVYTFTSMKLHEVQYPK